MLLPADWVAQRADDDDGKRRHGHLPAHRRGDAAEHEGCEDAGDGREPDADAEVSADMRWTLIPVATASSRLSITARVR